MASNRTQIYLSEEQRRRVDDLAERRGVSMATIVRDAVDAYLWEVREVDGATDETSGILPRTEAPDGANCAVRDELLRRVSVAAPADDVAFLETEARRRQVPLTVLLSEAVAEMAASLRRPNRPRLGLGASAGRSPGAAQLTGEPVAEPPR